MMNKELHNAIQGADVPDLVREGRPLPVPLRRCMERLLGEELSGVRVHVGLAPVALGALAFAHGEDLHFAPGCYEPTTARGLHLLAHELTHVVQQRRGRVRHGVGHGTALVIDADLEAEADAMGARARSLLPTLAAWKDTGAPVSPPPRRPARPAAVIQPYVWLGREMSGTLHSVGLAKETMRRRLTLDDVNEVMNRISEYFSRFIDADLEVIGTDGLSAEYVLHMKSLARHAYSHTAEIKALLSEWIASDGEALSTILGWHKEAHWRQYDTIAELAMALAHETHPQTLANVAMEIRLAQAVNNSKWICARLKDVVDKVNRYHQESTSTARYVLEYPESFLFGSYNLGTSYTKKVSNVLKLVLGSTTADEIEKSIVILHDTMERWSSSNAGSMAAKLHEKFIDKILPEPKDEAFSATVIDLGESNLQPNKSGRITVVLRRETRKVLQERRKEEELRISQRRAQRLGEKNSADILALTQEIQEMEEAGASPEKIALKQEKLKKRLELRRARFEADGYTLDTHRDEDLGGEARTSTLTSTPEDLGGGSTLTFRGTAPVGLTPRKVEPRNPMLPERGLIGEKVFAMRKESEKERLAKVTPGKVDKSSASKGRKNVGTRDEFDVDTLTARLFSAPITAGRSMTTARMMQLVDIVGGTVEEKTAVAYAIFAYWRLTYNRGLTPVHTFVETLDVAYNYGVPYVPFHYPVPPSSGEIDYMTLRNNKLYFMGNDVCDNAMFLPTKVVSTSSVVEEVAPFLNATGLMGERYLFREHRIANRDGRDCGFIALGIDRERAVEQLLARTHDAEIRALVAPEIRAAFLEGTLPEQMTNTLIFERLHRAYHAIMLHVDKVVREVNDALHLQGGNRLGLDGLIRTLTIGNGRPIEELRAHIQTSANLVNARTKLLKINEEMEELASSRDVYEAFVRYYIGGGGWLSYNRTLDERVTSSIDAIAELNDIQFYVWQRGVGDELVLVHHNLRPRSVRVVHMLHTNGLTHYNFLEKIN